MPTFNFEQVVNFNHQNSFTIHLGHAFQTQWTMILTRGSATYQNLPITGVIQRSLSTYRIQGSAKLTDDSPTVLLLFEIGQETAKASFALPIINSSTYKHTLTGSLTLHSYSGGKLLNSGDGIWDSNKFKGQSIENLSNNFMCMLQSADLCFSDVRLKCGDVVLPAHKCVLASRSPVFEAMFRSNMKDAKEGIIHIEDIDATVLKEMLSYIYTGQTSKLTDSLASLLLFAADKYQLAHLKDACIKYLSCNVSQVNVLSILMLGELHDRKLKNCALEFICYCEKISVFEKKPEWETLKTDKPDLVIEVLTSVVKFQQENTIPGFEMEKVNHNKTNLPDII